MLENANLFSLAREEVKNIFSDSSNDVLFFHNYVLTENIVLQAKELSFEEECSEELREIILFSVWFLFTGYTRNYNTPLPKSAEFAKDFLRKNNYDTEQIKKVEKRILQFDPQKKPEEASGKIINDAVFSFFGQKDFFRLAEQWRLEEEHFREEEYLSDEWNRKLMERLVEHRFYTLSAQKKFDVEKNNNILAQRKNLEKATKTSMRVRTGKDFGRGIDTLYRNTLRGHLDLSSIADGKANMIISINTIVLSILITGGSASISISNFNIQENIQFIVPTLILMTSSLGAIIFGVLSAIPKYSEMDFDMKDVKENKVSLLFFNNFLSVEKEEFVEYLNGLKVNQGLLYEDLARDVYNLGGVLKKKYLLLNIAYKLFVIGLALSFLCFFVLFGIYGF